MISCHHLEAFWRSRPFLIAPLATSTLWQSIQQSSVLYVKLIFLTTWHLCMHTHTHTHTHTLQSLGASPGAKPPTCHGTVSAAGSAARGRWWGAFWAARTAGWGAGPGSPAPPRCACWSCLTTPSCAVPQSPWPAWGKGWCRLEFSQAGRS